METTHTQTARDKLNRFLKQKGFKPTVERAAILDEALATEGHFEADDLLVILKQKGVKTSRATVYRTLELLYKSGFLQKVCLREAHIHFQKITESPRHDHLICTGCGGIYEFRMQQLEEYQNTLCNDYNFVMSDYCFQIFGLCQNCAGKKL